jgi:hypothetical protein
MTPIPMEYLIHGLGTACLALMTLAAISAKSRLAPLLAIVTGLVGYWLFLVLPVLLISPALVSLVVTDLGILSYAAKRSGSWSIFIYR